MKTDETDIRQLRLAYAAAIAATDAVSVVSDRRCGREFDEREAGRAFLAALDARDQLPPDAAIYNVLTDPIPARMLPGEAVFTLRGRDILADHTIRYWITLAGQNGVPTEKIAKAQEHLDDFVRWQDKHPELVRLPGTGDKNEVQS